MKHHGTKFEYEDERNHDLMSAFHRLIEEADYISLADIYNKVVHCPSVRFWVSEERAAIVISRMLKGDDLHYMSRSKQAMFREIFKRAQEIRKANPDITLFDVAFRVVRQPAPCFYLTPGSAKVIICSAKRKWYEERKRKLRHLF